VLGAGNNCYFNSPLICIVVQTCIANLAVTKFDNINLFCWLLKKFLWWEHNKLSNFLIYNWLMSILCCVPLLIRLEKHPLIHSFRLLVLPKCWHFKDCATNRKFMHIFQKLISDPMTLVVSPLLHWWLVFSSKMFRLWGTYIPWWFGGFKTNIPMAQSPDFFGT
jgi:hypothetical protein